MRLSEIKGDQTFKAIGGIVKCLREIFTDKQIMKIVNDKQTGWMLDMFSVSLEEKADVWMRMFLILNPDVKEEDVSIGNVIKFAYEFKNDEELMSLFFSQGEQMVTKSSGSPTENTEAPETT